MKQKILFLTALLCLVSLSVKADRDTRIGTMNYGTTVSQDVEAIDEYTTILATYPNACFMPESSSSPYLSYNNVVETVSQGIEGMTLTASYTFQKLVLTDVKTAVANGLAAVNTNFMNGMSNEFAYAAAMGYTIIMNGTAQNISYTRSLIAGNNSCCLPFGISTTAQDGYVTLPAGVTIRTFSRYDATANKVYFDEPTSVDAGVPCLLYCTVATDWEANYTGASAATLSMMPNNTANQIGSFEVTSDYSGTGYYGLNAAGTAFVPVNGGDVYPFRSVLYLGTSSSAPLNIGTIEEEEIATGLENTESAEDNQMIYTVDGRFLGSEVPAPGLYIVNGKIQFICK